MFFPSSFLSPGPSSGLSPPLYGIKGRIWNNGYVTRWHHASEMSQNVWLLVGLGAVQRFVCLARSCVLWRKDLCRSLQHSCLQLLCLSESSTAEDNSQVDKLLSSGVEAILACALMLRECWHAHGDSVSMLMLVDTTLSMLIVSVWHVYMYYVWRGPVSIWPCYGLLSPRFLGWWFQK